MFEFGSLKLNKHQVRIDMSVKIFNLCKVIFKLLNSNIYWLRNKNNLPLFEKSAVKTFLARIETFGARIVLCFLYNMCLNLKIWKFCKNLRDLSYLSLQITLIMIICRYFFFVSVCYSIFLRRQCTSLNRYAPRIPQRCLCYLLRNHSYLLYLATLEVFAIRQSQCFNSIVIQFRIGKNCSTDLSYPTQIEKTLRLRLPMRCQMVTLVDRLVPCVSLLPLIHQFPRLVAWLFLLYVS